MTPLQTIKRKLAGNGRILACPCCGSTDIDAPQHLTKGIALLYEDPSASWFAPPGYLAVVAASCGDCGHVMLFRREVTDDRPTRKTR